MVLDIDDGYGKLKLYGFPIHGCGTYVHVFTCVNVCLQNAL